MKMILFLALVLASISSQARHEGGSVVENGGSYVECKSELSKDISVNNIAVLDIFEGVVGQNLHYTKLAEFRGMPLAQAYPAAIAKFFARDTNQDMMYSHFERFRNQIEFTDDRLLPDLRIKSEVAEKKSCAVKQLAVQYIPFPAEPGADIKILIARNIWSSLETDQKVALLIHEFYEAIYYQIIGPCIYTEVRDRVGFILSDEALALSDREFQRQNRFKCTK